MHKGASDISLETTVSDLLPVATAGAPSAQRAAQGQHIQHSEVRSMYCQHWKKNHALCTRHFKFLVELLLRSLVEKAKRNLG